MDRKRILLALCAVGLLAILVVSHPSQQNRHGGDVSPTPKTGDDNGGATQQALPDLLHFGYTPDPEATRRFVRGLWKPYFSQYRNIAGAVQEAKAPTLLYRALYEADPGWQCSHQGIGDCVSHGWAHAIETGSAVELSQGTNGEFHRVATETIYGGARCQARDTSFAGWSDGAVGSSAALWVTKWGVLFRQPYDLVDLSVYSSQRAKNYGAYGCPAELVPIAKQHPVKTVALVRSFLEGAAAVEAGYPIAVCSQVGFGPTGGNVRDSQGFLRASNVWGHCMCFIGVRWGDRPGLLCINSWGINWVSGPTWPNETSEDDIDRIPTQPPGSFWIDAKTCDRMLAGGDSFAISKYEGFPVLNINHLIGW